MSLMLDGAIRIGLLMLLSYACARIVAPFVGISTWSAILAVMLDPARTPARHRCFGNADQVGRNRARAWPDHHCHRGGRNFAL